MENTECVTMAIQNMEEPEARQTKHKHDPLIHVIQKLSAMVESEKSSRCFEGRKRSYPDEEMQSDIQGSCASPSKSDDLDILPKRIKAEAVIDNSNADLLLPRERKVMFYQCSLCNFLSHSFEILKIHVKNHDQQNEIVLMCSDCHMTFKKHEDLEGHIKKHCETEDTSHPQQCKQLSASLNFPDKVRKKWYAYEDYGLYRCLICKYTCGQQRMLKTHAWKHAGEVDCSYPIFEEENESAGLPDSTVAHSPHGSESVLSEDAESRHNSQTPASDKGPVCDSLLLENTVKNTETINSAANPETIEVLVVDDSLSDAEQDNTITDSLLSSAQKIISCTQNKKGHVNVIVERLPSAEETVSPKALLISNDLAVKKKIVPRDSQIVCEGSVEVYHADKNVVENEEIIIGWSNTIKTGDFHESNENFPPMRRRTNSECLRLHSLAAEALVTMPISVVECPKSSLRILSKPDSLDPDTGQQEGDRNYATYSKLVSSKIPEKVDSCGQNVINLKESKEGSELKEAPIRMGISMSLLKVIERLRERTDQNATDDDILKELRDNAQTESTVDFASSSNVVEYLPHAERPYRCRLCHYSSDNKGYIKQHLRVHRQRQPYQCPICEHIADNSSDLENHMINHCKTRMYECKHCAESFYYKSQLRNHEREHRNSPDNRTLSTSSDEQQGSSGDNEDKQPSEGSKSCNQKLYRCDVCSYTSSTYVGVRNHRRIHTCDKPYRCSLCGYVCSHPPSLKSHMWKHASDQNYNYEQVNKAINEAMSQSSRIQVETIKKSSEDSDKVHVNSESSTRQSAYEIKNDIESPKVNHTQITLCNTEKLQSQMRPEAELCILLFCCCICGFESSSKELLMEHMKAHEGEIINIILNKSESTS
ncbi:zinc finger protein 507 isoform X2 [Xenopus laevis]|uniref:Zinc finger protein 507 n=1 Tax=Xenopus laevis TaxID=8355 RepID=A0A8J0VAY1_XENLA|nr:zinc finger protein 507 isoform X2 [Xenopus laevis]